MIKVVPIEGKGRGVVATQDIKCGTVIAAAPVLEIAPNTILEHHYWTHVEGDIITYYLTLGIQTLVNHSDTPNCVSFMHDDEDLLVSIRRINSGDELTLNYHDCCDSFDGTFD